MKVAWILAIALPSSIILWVTVCFIIAQLGGWASIAAKHPSSNGGVDESQFRGQTLRRFGLASLSLGQSLFATNYNNCVTIVVSENGILIEALFIFRFFHPPLFIPWSSVESCKEITQFFFLKRVALHTHGIAYPILFGGQVGQEILRHWNNQSLA